MVIAHYFSKTAIFENIAGEMHQFSGLFFLSVILEPCSGIQFLIDNTNLDSRLLARMTDWEGGEDVAHFLPSVILGASPGIQALPSRPGAEYNGCVEQANRTVRTEFYPFDTGEPTVASLNEALIEYLKLYNDYRLHQALDLMTANEYVQQRMAA